MASREHTDTRSAEDRALRAVVEGVESETGESFFPSLVRHLAEALAVKYAFVSELAADRQRFRTRAVWGRGQPLPNIDIPVAGTPCEAVLQGGIAHHPDRLCERFPEDIGLVEWGVESYAGVPLLDRAGTVLGHLAIFDGQPMPDASRGLAIMRIFAARAVAEIERLAAEALLRESEARFRDLYEEAPVAYLSIGTDGRPRQWNRQTLALFRCTPEQLAQSRMFDLAADLPEGRPRSLRIYERFLSGLDSLDEEVAYHRFDGGIIWGRVSVRPIRDASGGVVATRSMIVDITELKLAEQALRESEERYRELHDHSPAAYLYIDTGGRLWKWNRKAEEMLGYPPDRLRGMSFRDLCADGPTGKGRAEAMYVDFIAGRESTGVLEGRRADGSVLWVDAVVRPLRDEKGQVYSTQSVLVDVTAAKLAEEALRATEARLARILDSALDAIVAFGEDRTIEVFNGAAEQAFRCAATDAIGKPLDRFLTDGLARALETSLRSFAAGGAARPYVWAAEGLQARDAAGREFRIEATLSQVDVGGRPLYTLILRDVEARERAEEEVRQLHRQNDYLQEEIKSLFNFEELIGQSPAFQDVLRRVALVAGTDSSVLITGETGTGKELIARAVHSNGRRKDRPLIKVNCAALPSGLIESELFGHEKGAFTGAVDRRVGRFELAHGGTIFLDEIGELPLELQAKLLRVLQEQEFERIGGARTIRVDVRVIAATNRDLARAVAEGGFRQDLYYRLNVFPITLPPLRARPDDVPLLVHYFLGRYTTKIGRRITRVPDAAMRRLQAYAWPGNVRELENVIERAVILSPGPELEMPAEVLPLAAPRPAAATPAAAAAPAATTLEQVERDHIVSVLRQTGWRVDGPQGAARILAMNPSTLRSRMQKLGIRRSASDAS
jgi:PAS domain S-box-containing protein